MKSLIPAGLSVPPNIIESEYQIASWQNKDGSIHADAPRFIKDIYSDILDAVNTAKNETEKVLY